MEMNSPENATVESYLTYLKSPESLIDENLVRTRQAAVDGAISEIERLLAVRDLREAEQPDVDVLRREFRRVLPKWAAENRVTRADLAAIGVPSDDLSALTPTSSSRAKSPRRASASRSGGQTSIDERVIGRLAEKGPLTIRALAEGLSLGESAIENAAKRLLAAGRLTSTKSPGSVGRPATVFHLL